MAPQEEQLVLIINKSGVPVWVTAERARTMVGLEGARVADLDEIRLTKNGTVGMNVNKVRASEESGDGRRGRKASPVGDAGNSDS